jgi:histidine triad (HIT) family protein
MPTIFSRIVAGEIPCYRIAENDEFLAFLDITPVAKGHTLVIPKMEVDYIFDIDDATLGRLFAFSKQVAIQLQKAVPCRRIGMSVIGLEVPHAHVHLLPLNTMADINFSGERIKMSPDQFAQLASLINSCE